MTKLTPSFSVCAAIILLSVGITPLANAGYIFTDLGTLGGTYSRALAINNAGQVVGLSLTAGNAYHATLWNGTTATDLMPYVYNSVANAINNNGQVAGQSYTADGLFHATVWNGNTATDLGSLGATTDSDALAMNNAGQVAGVAYTTGGAYHATLWNGTTATDLGTLGGNGSLALAINNSGQVAGVAETTEKDINGNFVPHATVWNGNTATDLGTLGGSASGANGINNAGQVVGGANITGNAYSHATLWNGTTATDLGTLGERGGTDNSVALAINNIGQIVGFDFVNCSWCTYSMIMHYQRATLWDGTTIIDLNSVLDASTISAGWELIDAMGINDNGWIAGNAYNNLTGQTDAYLLSVMPTPNATVPEPATYTMLLAGLGLMGFTVRRRKVVTA